MDDGAVDAIVRAGLAPLITNVWLNDVLSTALNPSLPTMVNTDGDEIVFCTARYPLAPGASKEGVRSCLRGVPALREASETVWNWVEAGLSANQRGARSAPKTDGRAGQFYRVTLDDGATVLGMVELTDDAVVLTTNSPARAERAARHSCCASLRACARQSA